MADVLVVPVTELLRRPGRRRGLEAVLPVDEIAPDGLTVLDARVPAKGEVAVDVELESLSNGVMVTGRVAAPFTAECRRCLAPVSGHLTAEVRELFSTGEPAEEGSFRVEEERLDLAPMVREALTLELPLAPLCAEACAGLCPQCGADLNQGHCGCTTVMDPRWSALDAWRDDFGRTEG